MRKPMAVLILAAVIGLIPVTVVSEDFWAQVTFVKGTVTVSGPQHNPASAVSRGDVFKAGAVVSAAASSRATLLLSDGSIVAIPPGKSLTLGPKAKDAAPGLKAVAQNLSKTLLSRAGDNPMNKNLGATRGAKYDLALAPRGGTAVMRDGVQLLWLPKYGVKKYVVMLQGGPEDRVTDHTVEQTSLLLPAGALAPGSTYYWEVRDANDRDSMNTLGNGVFRTLPEAAEKDVEKITALILSASQSADGDTSGLFLQYQLYRQHNLNLDALRILEKMISLDPADTALPVWRKELCQQMRVQEEHVPLIAAP